LSNRRWIVGGKLCLLLNKLGLVVAWACDTANVSDTVFQPLIKQYEAEMMVETVLSMLTLVRGPAHRPELDASPRWDPP
jgi:hypothetical protein